MFGDSNNKGIIPLLCINICKESAIMEKDNNSKIKVEFSMVEIYNEKLLDLMSDRNTQLQIREATTGFFSLFISLIAKKFFVYFGIFSPRLIRSTNDRNKF